MNKQVASQLLVLHFSTRGTAEAKQWENERSHVVPEDAMGSHAAFRNGKSNIGSILFLPHYNLSTSVAHPVLSPHAAHMPPSYLLRGPFFTQTGLKPVFLFFSFSLKQTMI